MAFVFRGDKTQALNKINPNLGPGNLFDIQVLTTLKYSEKIKFLKHMFLLVVWNQKQDRALITQHL
jgi:hypothetical protein